MQFQYISLSDLLFLLNFVPLYNYGIATTLNHNKQAQKRLFVFQGKIIIKAVLKKISCQINFITSSCRFASRHLPLSLSAVSFSPKKKPKFLNPNFFIRWNCGGLRMVTLSWKHHTLIQALISRGPLKEKEFHTIFTGVTGRNPGLAPPSYFFDSDEYQNNFLWVCAGLNFYWIKICNLRQFYPIWSAAI